MNAEQVVQKILAEAEEQARKILDEAKAKAAEQGSQLDSEIAEFGAKTDQLAADAGEDKLQRMLAGARMDNGKQLLAAKVEILNDVFERAKKAVNDLPDERYLLWAMIVMKQAVESGDEEVIVGKDEKRINADFIKKVNGELGSGFKGNLKLSAEKGDFSGGFILSHGKVQVNATTDVIIDDLRESMQIELSQTLLS
jgi:V/A-type H+-transporting ATPase subunit E